MRFLKGLFGGVLLLVAAVAVFVYIGKSSGQKVIQEFLDRAATAPAAELQGTFHASLAQSADLQQVAAFAREIATRFGKFQGVDTNGFRFQVKTLNGSQHSEFAGTFRFEKRPVPMALGFLDDQLFLLRVDDEEIGKELVAAISHPPGDAAPYQAQAGKFLEAMFGGEADEAFGLMSEPLRQQIGRELFGRQVAAFAHLGALKSVSFEKSEVTEAEPDRLHLAFQVAWEGATLPAKVSFQFLGLKSYLIAYGVAAPPPAATPGTAPGSE